MLSDHEENRLAKVEQLRLAGKEPFKVKFDRTHEIGEILEKHSGLEAGVSTGNRVAIGGRVMTVRRHGKAAFADLQDSTGRMQLFARADALGDSFESFTELDIGDWVGATGVVMTTRKGELSVELEAFELLSKSLRPWPEKWHGLKDVELRYRQRYLDLATNPEARTILKARVETVSSLRDNLNARGFMEVETPMLQPIHGGAMAKPFVTHHNVLDMPLYLRIAPELYLKRLVVGGLEKVFEISRVFRNEGASVKYNPEFTMLEAYEAFVDYNDVADLLEDLVRQAALSATGSMRVIWQGEEIDLENPFRRVRLIDLVAELGVDVEGDLVKESERLGVPHDPAWSWGKLLVEIFEKKIETKLIQPTFVFDYPVEVSPLARLHRNDVRFTEHLDMIIGGMEVGVAYSELIDPVDQRRRFEAQVVAREAGDDEAHLIDEDFLKALEHGLPPTGGLGLGVDRLVMLLTDSRSIREVILFPALRPEGS